MEKLNANYWNSRYKSNNTAWDLGIVSPPIKKYIDQLENKELRILIPGAGNAYEAIYLLESGFKNITVVDFAEEPLKRLNAKLENRNINKANYHLIHDDFFNHDGVYDLQLEQTFFCALNPILREKYVQHTHHLLGENGKIVGLLFNREFPFEGPPFGGNELEYRKLFESKFQIKTMEEAYNSTEPRRGTELFVNLHRK